MAISSSLFWMVTVLAQAQTGPMADEKHLSKPKFRIPVALQAEKVASLQGVLLYVSNNRGKSWELHGRIKPDEGSFQYLAKSDGVYWFKVAVLDKQGNQDPRDIYQAEDCMKIVVDSLPPEVKLTAEKQDSSIQVRWNVREDNPELATMKLEARIPGGDAWLPVQIKPGLSGSGTLQVPQPGPVELRLSLADRAGNLGLGEAQVGMDGQTKPGLPVLNAGVPGAFVSKPAGEPGTVPGAVVPVAGPTNSPAVPPGVPSASAMVSGIPPAPGALPAPNLNIPAPAPVPSAAPSAVALPTGPVGLAPPQPPMPQPMAGAGIPPGNSSISQPSLSESVGMPNPAHGVDQPVLASSSGYASPGVAIGGSMSRMGSSGKPVQVVNRRQVRLEYEVTKTGSSGVGAAEVYATLDDGLNWSLVATEPVTISPSEAAGVGAQRFSVMLPLTQEGVVHGFTLVVKSKAGLGRPAPQRGESPQIRVELDSTHPDASLLNVVADPNRREALVINYKASDRNLAQQPVQLEWAERRDGPWNSVTEGEIANTGKYLWLVPPQVPPSVFMRLTVKDKAGNVAIAQTPEPILVDLHVPEFNLLGIQPR